MGEIEKDWQVRKLIQIYESYFAPLQGRTRREGRSYLHHAFKAALSYEGLHVDSLGAMFEHVEGDGDFFLLAGTYIVDLA